MHGTQARYAFSTNMAQLCRYGLFVMLLCLVSLVSFGQTFTIFNGTTSTCAGSMLDSGGQGGSGYGNNESFTYTICPDAPGGAISLDFITFNLSTAGAAPIDGMTIHDGDNTGTPVLGTWTGNTLQGQVVSATAGNGTGCLTVVFTSNNNGTGVFAAAITCYQPCARPTAVATHGTVGPQRICPGESVTFNSSASFAAPGFAIASRRWEFGDGTVLNNAGPVVNHTYAQPGGYTAQLYLVDNNGCASTNRVDLQVLVGTEPNFQGTGGQLLGCAGETLCLTGVVNGTTWNELPETDLGGGVFLPDNVGQCFTSELTYTQFLPGQTLTNVNDLQTICMDIEHSYIGDLVISIISPNGQSVVLHQQGGGGTFLGEPIDNDLNPKAQGVCYTYCFSPTATNGTWVDNAGGTLPAGTYESVDPLSGLIGSPLNGTWTIEVCDLFSSDNGFICNWGLAFNPALYDDLITFTPVYGAGCDSSAWSGPHVSSTGANCNSICVTPPGPGNYAYTYTATDNFGCSYDTTLTVTIVPGPIVNAGADASTCNTPVQLGASVSGGFPTNCVYTLNLFDSFGDGWTGIIGSNGSQVTITVNGISSSWNLAGGAFGSVAIPVQQGDAISLSYTAGSIYNGEQSYTLVNGSGAVVYASPIGPATGFAWSGTVSCPGGNFIYSWNPPAGLSDPNIPNPIATVAGTTTYCVTVYQAGHPDCVSSDCMTITVDNTVDPGTSAATTICANAAAVDLFSALGGTPTAGGTWTAPGGAVHSGSFVPGADLPGVYTYTVGGAGACGGTTVSSTVTVSVSPVANAGTSSSVSLCANGGTIALFSSLGGTPQAGGSWSGPSGAHGGTFDPAVDAPGLYTYTVAGVAPCPPATATVSVAVSQPVDAGVDNNIVLCSSNGPVALLGQLGGTPDGTGSWTDPNGVAIPGGIDPATALSGDYTYTVLGTSPCPNDAATLSIAINSPPDPGTNGSTTLCSTDAAVDLFALLGGTPDAGGVWSGPSALAGSSFDPATMNAGVYTYTVAGVAPCPAESATVTVVVNTPPDPGTDGSTTLCSTDAATDLFALLGGTPDAGGVWSGPSALAGSSFDPATMNAGLYTYTVAGVAPCPAENATVTVVVNTPPDPGTDGSTTLCSTDAAVDLFALLGGTPDAGGVWSGPSALAGSSFDPATMNAGVYTYTVAGVAPCPSESATVTVVVNTPPDPGTNGSSTLCSTGAATDLFALLGGTPDVGGVWSGPSALAGSSFDPATMNAGVYTYTVAGVAPCPAESATVTVVVNTPPDPGTDGSTTLCSTDAATDLFALLGGTPDAGGVWSGPSALAGSSFDPATMSAGVYTYTVAGVAPCPAESATVTVVVNTPPDPGTDGSTTLCSTGAATDLFALLGGTPDVGGVWSGPSALAGSSFDPATMNAGVYTYTVAGVAPCPAESATVTVVVNTPPDPGTDGSTTLCSTDAATDLFALLGGTPDAGGVWSGPSALAGSSFDPATMSAGVYTYTVAGVAPCPAESATVTVVVNTPPDPGTDGSTTLCSTDAAVDLFALLGGTPDAGGVWSGPSALAGSSFDPATMSAGVYTYTVAGVAPCPAENATVTVVVNTPPDPGTDGSTTLCSTDASVDLFALLGGTPDVGGVWSGPSALAGSSFDPATMNAGVYTYTVAGVAPCPAESATVTVVVNTPPNAGLDGAIALCSSSPATALSAGLAGTFDAGGIWTGPGGAVVGPTFTPGVSAVGTYVYTVAGTPPCPADQASVLVSVLIDADAGTPGTITLCSTDVPFDLFAELGGTPDAGGAWSGPSAVVGGAYDPATMAPGVYTYTITVPPPCVSVSSTVTVTEVAPPNAGADGSLTLCISSPATALLPALGGAPQAGGVWSGPSAVVGGLFNPATMNAGTYTYTVAGATPCPADAAVVSVTVVDEPDAGTPGTITLCSTDAPFDLFAELGGTPDAGGAWSGPSAVVGGAYDPATMAPGVYTYTITVPPPCVSMSSTVTVTEVAPPNAGADGSLTLCISSPATALFPALGGAPQAGGVWSGPSAVVGGLFNPATMNAGTYTYTVAGATPCPADAAVVSVTVVDEPDAGTPGTITLCSTDAPFDLFAELGGAPDAGGAWSGPSAVVGGAYDPATMAPGVYTYTITVPPPCVPVSSTVTVTVIIPPNAGTDGALALCASGEAVPLISGLNGTPDPGGTWNGPSIVIGGVFDPDAMTPGTYTYTVNGTAPCPADAALVDVAVVDQPFAGGPGSLTVCSTGMLEDLFTRLEGTPDIGGTWTTPNGTSFDGVLDPQTMGSGTYTYSINVPPPCISTSATVDVEVIDPPMAGADGNVTFCSTDGSAELFPDLGGTPQLGGSWSTSAGAAWSGTFDPSVDAAGAYLYIVAGTTPCPADTAVVNVSIVQPPDPGSDAVVNLCVTGGPVDLFPFLGGADVGGSWSSPGVPILDGVFDPVTHPAGSYTYTVSGTVPCPALSAVITVQVLSNADAGNDGAITLCQLPDQVSLFDVLGGAPDAGGSWSGPDNATHSGLLDPGVALAGTYRYIVEVPLPCLNDTAEVLVSLETPVDAGSDGTLTLCSDNAVTELIDQLNGDPDNGGTWTYGDGTVDGSFDPSNEPQGTYTYSVLSGGVCPDASASVLVTVHPLPIAGTNGSTTVCPEAPAFALLPLLGATPDPGGTWTAPDGSTFNGLFDPATDAPGIYTYTVFGTAPCPNATASATIAIHVVPQPDAGPNVISCTLEGSVLATGTWSTGSWSGTTGLSFGDVTSAGTTVSVSTGGLYTAVWSTISSDGCAASDSVQLIFTDALVPVITVTNAICNGACDGTASVNTAGGNVLNGNYSYDWSIVGSDDLNTIDGLCAGTYTVAVADTNGCATTTPFTISEPVPLEIAQVIDVDETCPGTCDGRIVVIDTAGVLFSMDGANYQPTNQFTDLCPGTYTVWMQNADGCIASAPASIGTPAPVEAGFIHGPDTLFIDASVATFTNTSSSNATSFLWDFGTGDASTATSPTYAFPGGLGGSYTVCLTAMDVNGCADSVCTIIPVFDRLLVFVPNAFTPNRDGFNEGFRPVFNLPFVVDYEFAIFDRWGERIFASQTLDEAWDGTYGSSVVQTEVYVWKLTCRDQLSGELIERIGHVTVLQ